MCCGTEGVGIYIKFTREILVYESKFGLGLIYLPDIEFLVFVHALVKLVWLESLGGGPTIEL